MPAGRKGAEPGVPASAGRERAARPRESTTILMTNIEGSVATLRQLPDSCEEDLRAHLGQAEHSLVLEGRKT